MADRRLPREPRRHGTAVLTDLGHEIPSAERLTPAALGIPLAQFAVDDVRAEYERLSGLGVRFTQEPLDMGPVTTAVFDDTCGNLIQIATQPQE